MNSNENINAIYYSVKISFEKNINKNKNFNESIYTLMNTLKNKNNEDILNMIILKFNKTFNIKINSKKNMFKNKSQYIISNKVYKNITSSRNKINTLQINSQNVLNNKILKKKHTLKNEKSNLKTCFYYLNTKFDKNKPLPKIIIKDYSTLLKKRMNSKSLFVLYGTLNNKINTYIQNELKNKKEKNKNILKNSRLYINKNFQNIQIKNYEEINLKTEYCLKSMKINLNNIMNNTSLILKNKILNSEMMLAEIGLFKFEITNSSIFKINCFIVNKKYDNIKNITKDILSLIKTKELSEKNKEKIINSLEGFVNA
ncbi:hypothetical protein OSSY52_00760 [Tepiditoga spiralis]|uniref:Uncharacterized protein n=1 Tax=Tepiditoga spiralis TaxID=2108365 RepID=A0A7G1G254_9BACT|nr:hypothetical protein [Tepiditoga spiralis]BBE29935.1 hypothetical protein OSSY52_00760 [Tepiditoga spiralis]